MVKNSRIVRKKQTGAVGARPGGDPPAAFRFVKGVSGNVKGRPKGSKNLKTLVMDAAGDKVGATINGRSRKITKLQAAVMQLATKAANGDHKAMTKFVELVDDMESRASVSRPVQYPFGEADLRVLHEMHQRMKQCNDQS